MNPESNLAPTAAEALALENGQARIYKGRVIPIMRGGENPDPAADPGLVADPADPDPDSRPDWLNTRYQSVEDQAKAYPEAEKKIAEVNRRLSERERALEEAQERLEELSVQQQPYTYGQQNVESNPLVLAYQQAVDEGNVVAQLQIQAQLTTAAVEQALKSQKAPEVEPDIESFTAIAEMQVRNKFGQEEYDGSRDKILDKLEMFPGLISQASSIGEIQQGIETAYSLVKADAVNAGQQSLAQQQAAAEAARQRKAEAETLSGTGPTRVAPESEQKAAWDRIKGVDLGTIRLGGVD